MNGTISSQVFVFLKSNKWSDYVQTIDMTIDRNVNIDTSDRTF